jgi:hypothetical protein
MSIRQIEQIKYFIDANIPNAKYVIWTNNIYKCDYQKNGFDCGVYMLTFSVFLTDFDIQSCEEIDCEKNARLKISLDLPRGFVEDPRLAHIGMDEYAALASEQKPIVDLTSTATTKLDTLQSEIEQKHLHILSLMDQLQKQNIEIKSLKLLVEVLLFIIIKNK